MTSTRFDAIAKALAGRRTSRRIAAKVAGLGIAAVAGASNLRAASAQDGTPAAPPSTEEELTNGAFLFVQTAASGTFVPNPGSGTPDASGGADYLLTLEGHDGGTVYFSDRPERIFGEAPTGRFLDGLGFPPDNPPNAALVVQTEAGEDVLVVELMDPSYDESASTITYGANVLGSYDGEGLAFAAAKQQDDTIDEQFGRVSLFIDDCPDITNCYLGPVSQGPVPGGPIGTCWTWSSLACLPCDGRSIERINASCNSTYSSCNNICTVFFA